jgi:Bacterial transglutaminase-like cysteine proteinase BTLCP
MCTLLLAFTGNLNASLPHDPFEAKTLVDASDGIAGMWRDELARIATDQQVMNACVRKPSADCGAVLKLIAIIDEASTYHGRAVFGHINRAINLLLRPTPGAWLSPLDVLWLGDGDCKAYALAKYFALRQAGLSSDRLRLVIVRNKRRPEDHMVVAAYEADGWLILDNRTMALVTDADASAVYSPIFVLDDTGTRRYILSAN